MRPALLSEPADALPANPRRGIAGTVVLHATGVVVLLLATAVPRLSPVAVPDGPVVALVPPPDSLPPPVLVVSEVALPAVDAMPPSSAFTTADGFTYDTS